MYSYDCSNMCDFVPVIKFRLLHQTLDPWQTGSCWPVLCISDLFSNNMEFKMHGDFYKTLRVPCFLKLQISNICWLLQDVHVLMDSQDSPFYLR